MPVYVVGDSKTWANLWLCVLSDTLSLDGWSVYDVDAPMAAVSGYGVAGIAGIIDSYLAATSFGPPPAACCNLGVNDVGSLPPEATWIANYEYIIDAILTKWPAIKVYIVKPWRRGYAAECNTLAGWIDTIIADYAGNVLVGHDERIWLEGGDDGATMTTDGTHYSDAGQAECASQWETILTA